MGPRRDDPGPLFAAIREQMHAAFGALAKEVEGLSEAHLDQAPGRDMSSLTVLVHHSIESARSILLDVAGVPTSGRDREASFRVRGVSDTDLRSALAEWGRELDGLLDQAMASDLARPITRFREATAAWWVVHAMAHTREHAAHAAMTRQLVLAGRPAD